VTREERARARAARVLIDGRLVAVRAKVHGKRSTYNNHGCQCAPCCAANAKRLRDRRAQYRAEHPLPVRVRKPKPSPRVKPVVVPKVCAAEGCDEIVPYAPGERPSHYRRRKYHGDACRNYAKASNRGYRPAARECARDGCDEQFRPHRGNHRFHSHRCSVLARGPRRPRTETKMCACPCRQEFARPGGISADEWGRRKFRDAEHRRRGERKDGVHPLATRSAGGAAPGAARAGNRRAPRPVPSRDRLTQTAAAATPVSATVPREVWRPANIGRDVRPRLPARAH